jgi:hypothetical protein
MLGDEAHEAWLEAYAPGWAEMGEAELADVVEDHVEETEFPQVFEDTAGGLVDDAEPPAERSGALFDDHGDGARYGHAHQAPTGGDPAHDRGRGDARMDEEAEAILEEAREMTRRMLEADADDGDGSGGEASGADDGDGSGGEASGADASRGGSGRRG